MGEMLWLSAASAALVWLGALALFQQVAFNADTSPLLQDAPPSVFNESLAALHVALLADAAASSTGTAIRSSNGLYNLDIYLTLRNQTESNAVLQALTFFLQRKLAVTNFGPQSGGTAIAYPDGANGTLFFAPCINHLIGSVLLPLVPLTLVNESLLAPAETCPGYRRCACRSVD